MFALKVLFNFSIFYLKNITNGLKKLCRQENFLYLCTTFSEPGLIKRIVLSVRQVRPTA